MLLLLAKLRKILVHMYLTPPLTRALRPWQRVTALKWTILWKKKHLRNLVLSLKISFSCTKNIIITSHTYKYYNKNVITHSIEATEVVISYVSLVKPLKQPGRHSQCVKEKKSECRGNCSAITVWSHVSPQQHNFISNESKEFHRTQIGTQWSLLQRQRSSANAHSGRSTDVMDIGGDVQRLKSVPIDATASPDWVESGFAACHHSTVNFRQKKLNGGYY